MKVAKIGINGGGRIGRVCIRCVLKARMAGDLSVDVVAVNDIAVDATYMAYLIKYDTTHGKLDVPVTSEGDTIKIGTYMTLKIFKERDPSKINWSSAGVDYVIESTGCFTTREHASKHITGGAKRVVISAPSADCPMFVYGVNHETYNPSQMQVISNASCTTNCLAPLAKVIDDNFGIVQGLMSTVHATTATQPTVDGPSLKDWRGGRAASVNIIPSSTGAAKAVGKVIPVLEGKLTGMAFRVPPTNVSVVDFTCVLKKPATKADIDNAVIAAANGPMKGVIEFIDFAAVSSDFNSTPSSCVYDSTAMVTFDPTKPQTMFKFIAWYDNEMGYSSRMIDLIRYIATKE